MYSDNKTNYEFKKLLTSKVEWLRFDKNTHDPKDIGPGIIFVAKNQHAHEILGNNDCYILRVNVRISIEFIKGAKPMEITKLYRIDSSVDFLSTSLQNWSKNINSCSASMLFRLSLAVTRVRGGFMLISM